MQIFYFTLFMASLIAYAVFGVSPATTKFQQDKSIIAAHMAAWHNASAKDCRATSCGTGTVDPTTYLYPSQAAGAAFAAGRFTTQYDATSKLLVTSVQSTVPTKTGLSFGAIESGLAEISNGESSSFGVFSKSTSQVNLVSHQGPSLTTTQSLPASIAASIPDGSPVIFSNM